MVLPNTIDSLLPARQIAKVMQEIRTLNNDGSRSPHVTFVRGPIVCTERSLNNPAVPSISLAYLTAYLQKADVSVDWVDAVGEGLDEYWPIREFPDYMAMGLTIDEIVARIPEKTDMVAVNAMFSGEWPLTRIMIEAIRSRFPSMIIIAGGEHITALTEFSLRDCPALDICVHGEGEHILADLVEALFKGTPLDKVVGIARLDDEGRYLENGGLSRNRDIDQIP